jgi:hypothetical protein
VPPVAQQPLGAGKLPGLSTHAWAAKLQRRRNFSTNPKHLCVGAENFWWHAADFFLFWPFLIIIKEMNPVKHFFQIWPF